MNQLTIKYLKILSFILLLIINIVMISLNIYNGYFKKCQRDCVYNPMSGTCIGCKYPIKPSWYQFINNTH